MRQEKMIRYMNLIDSKYIAEADPANAKSIAKRKSRTSMILRYGALAASFVLVVGVLLAMPYLQHDDPVLPDQTDNVHESTDPITSNHGSESTENPEPSDIIAIIPMTGKWDVFDLLGKPALFNLLTDEQAATVPYETNPLLYYVNEEGVWVFWSILENDWTMDEILEIYGIISADSILQIDITEKNTKEKAKVQVIDSELITEFYRIMQTADVMHRIPWGEFHSLQSKDEYDIDTVMYVDILTENNDVFSLQLYQHADCMVQNGDTFYQLKTGEGEKLFYLLKKITVNEFKESLKDIEERITKEDVETESVVVEN